jgi:hypothetical protein
MIWLLLISLVPLWLALAIHTVLRYARADDERRRTWMKV